MNKEVNTKITILNILEEIKKQGWNISIEYGDMYLFSMEDWSKNHTEYNICETRIETEDAYAGRLDYIDFFMSLLKDCYINFDTSCNINGKPASIYFSTDNEVYTYFKNQVCNMYDCAKRVYYDEDYIKKEYFSEIYEYEYEDENQYLIHEQVGLENIDELYDMIKKYNHNTFDDYDDQSEDAWEMWKIENFLQGINYILNNQTVADDTYCQIVELGCQMFGDFHSDNYLDKYSFIQSNVSPEKQFSNYEDYVKNGRKVKYIYYPDIL